MAILVMTLVFLAAAALGLVTVLTIVKGPQRSKLVQRKRVYGLL
jgi:hypothetical protein